MTEVPFLGCKISLISKCDIRYEGILYCVDPKESTISLSKVRSYGTESRGDPANYVPPKNDVYDVIIFRASDVKDLRVDAPEPPGFSDPAIISARQSSNATFDGINNTGSLPTSSGPSHQQSQQAQQHQKPLLPFLPTGSSKDQHPQSQPVINYSSAVASNAQRRTRPDNRKADHEPSTNNRKSDNQSGRDNIRRGGEIGDRRDDRRDDRRTRPNNVDRRDHQSHHRDGGGRRNDDGRQPRINRGGYDRNHMNQNSRYNNSSSNRRGPNHRDEGSMNRRRSGPFQGGRRGRSGDRAGAPRGPRKTAPLKFEGEYDFDEANKIFLELESKFKNMKVKDGEKNENGELSGDRANSKSPGGKSESGSGYDSDDHKDADSKDGGSEPADFYDRSRSFFDNISCEANERGQGKIGKPDWRKERQTNAETFGISANYRRGGYRGRAFGANGYHRR